MNKKYLTFFLKWFDKILQVPYPGLDFDKYLILFTFLITTTETPHPNIITMTNSLLLLSYFTSHNPPPHH